MLEKGIVLELKPEYALAMKQGGGVIRIKRKPGMVEGDQIYILPEDLYEKRRNLTVLRTGAFKPPAVRKIARMTAAAAMAILVILALIPGLSTTAYAVVSLDGQQHIQLQVDEDQSILGASSPDESLPEIELRKFRGKNLLDLGPELTELLGSGPILVAYAAYDGSPDLQTEQQIRQMFRQSKVLYLIGTAEDISGAAENSQSLGLYMLELLMGEDHTADLDDFYEDYFGLDDDDDGEDEIDHDDSDDALDAYAQMPLQEMIDLARTHPELMNNEEFVEALEEKQEDQDEEISDDDPEESEDAGVDSDTEENDTEDDDSENDAENNSEDDSEGDSSDDEGDSSDDNDE